ncbi:MAG TPA: hypothetical protein VMP01_10765 [Pirellulaceae bacterium]|nr:hypothetical protein [Pirellulaceae bacterium]
MTDRKLLLGWAIANASGMALGFFAFIQTLMFLGFGLDFGQHWSIEAAESFGAENPEYAEQLLKIGLVVGLPLAGAILTSCQALVVRGLWPQVCTWILAGPLGFAAVILLIWPFTAIWGDIPGPVEPFTVVGGGLLATAIIQWLSLRRQGIAATRWLVLWIAGLPLGMVVFMGIYILIDLVVSVVWVAEILLIGFCVGGTAAALSGKSLFRAISSRSAPAGD